MSTLDAARRHIRRPGGSDEPLFRFGRVALLMALLLGAVLGVAEMHLLATRSADDFGSFLVAES